MKMGEYCEINHKGKKLYVHLQKIPLYLKKGPWKDKNWVADEILPRTSTKRGIRVISKNKPKMWKSKRTYPRKSKTRYKNPKPKKTFSKSSGINFI